MAKLRENYKIILVYLAEAHADDVWPLGFGIKQTASIEARKNQCASFLKKWDDLAKLVDHVFVDNMENAFNEKTGCWPEGYMFADPTGTCLMKCELENEEGTLYNRPLKLSQVLNKCTKFARK